MEVVIMSIPLYSTLSERFDSSFRKWIKDFVYEPVIDLLHRCCRIEKFLGGCYGVVAYNVTNFNDVEFRKGIELLCKKHGLDMEIICNKRENVYYLEIQLIKNNVVVTEIYFIPQGNF